MPVQFTNADVAAKYDALREKDGKVHVPAGKVYGSGYAGPLSKITLLAADKAFANGANLLKLKTASAEKKNTKLNGEVKTE